MTTTTAFDRRSDRASAVAATVTAIARIEGIGVSPDLVTIQELVRDSTSMHWQYMIDTQAHGKVHVFEDADGVTILKRIDGQQRKVWFHEEPVVSVLSRVLTQHLIGRTIIPVASRRQMREVIAAAQGNAAYHFREGMYALLTDPGTIPLSWGTLDESERWEAIYGAYEVDRKVPSGLGGYMPLNRRYGVPLQVLDIYDEAYIERASELMLGITTRNVNAV